MCLDDVVLLKIWEFESTDELLGCRLAGLVALAIRLFEASERLFSIKVKFELPVALTDELTFSGWLKLLEFCLEVLLREIAATGSCPIVDWLEEGSCIEWSVFNTWWLPCRVRPSLLLITSEDSVLSS